MAEPGDKLERTYRGLAREEPSSALDASILDASRRAVRRSSSSRWAVPVSIAAVLMLAVGVTMRMQEEEPGVETSPPRSAPPPATEPAPSVAPERAPARSREEAPPASSMQAPAPQPRRDKLERQHALEKKAKVVAPPEKPAADAATRSYAEPAPAAPPAAPPAVQSAPLAFPAQKNFAPAAGAPGIAPQAAPAAPPPPAAAAGAAAARVAPAPASSADMARSPEQELERIARLRAEGRDDEADRALGEFRKRYPDYRIADAMWERVRPRR